MEKNTVKLIFGIVLICLGIVLFLNAMGLLDVNVWNNIWKFWPVVLMALGIKYIIKSN